MCELADHLRLCTCAGETLADPDWVLERRDSSIPEQHRRGRALVPRYDAEERECIDALLAALEAGVCFDFDYAPREGDVLTLRALGRRVRFRYTRTWRLDESNSLDGWRAQMVPGESGRLG